MTFGLTVTFSGSLVFIFLVFPCSVLLGPFIFFGTVFGFYALFLVFVVLSEFCDLLVGQKPFDLSVQLLHLFVMLRMRFARHLFAVIFHIDRFDLPNLFFAQVEFQLQVLHAVLGTLFGRKFYLLILPLFCFGGFFSVISFFADWADTVWNAARVMTNASKATFFIMS